MVDPPLRVTNVPSSPRWNLWSPFISFHRYVVDAGPTLNASFDVVGGIFDRVYANGNPAPENTVQGIQTVEVPVGGGAVFEVRPDEAGDYLFVSHAFAQANKGAVGVLRVGHLPESTGQNIDH